MIKINNHSLNSIVKFTQEASPKRVKRFLNTGCLNELSTDVYINSADIVEKGKIPFLELQITLKNLKHQKKEELIKLEKSSIGDFLLELNNNLSLSLHNFMRQHSLYK